MFMSYWKRYGPRGAHIVCGIQSCVVKSVVMFISSSAASVGCMGLYRLQHTVMVHFEWNACALGTVCLFLLFYLLFFILFYVFKF